MLLKECLLVLMICIGLGHAMRSCISNENCEEGECCISMAFFRGFCHTLGDEGDHCILEPAKTKHGEKNIFGCPCKEGLKCTPGEVIKEGGKTIMKGMSCVRT